MTILRRAVLSAMAATPALTTTAFASNLPIVGDPRKSAAGGIKMTADLDTAKRTPWWYDISMYVVRPNMTPTLILLAEGCEVYSVRAQANGDYWVRGTTVTCFKDVASGAWIDRFHNPVTGNTVLVKPNLIEGGTTIYKADGSGLLRDTSDIRTSEKSFGREQAKAPFPAGASRWIETGDRICWIRETRTSVPIHPLVEVSTLWADRKAFYDPRVTRVEATFSSTSLTPWLGWLEMKTVPGHMMWAATGRKLASLDHLPESFRKRAEQLAPGRLAQDPFA